jgi:hypothetical protein
LEQYKWNGFLESEMLLLLLVKEEEEGLKGVFVLLLTQEGK